MSEDEEASIAWRAFWFTLSHQEREILKGSLLELDSLLAGSDTGETWTTSTV
jgi:hypothetical protein